MAYFLIRALILAIATVSSSFPSQRPNGLSTGFTGRVLDQDSGQPVVDAVVQVKTVNGTLLGATTEQNGTFEIWELPNGRHVLSVSRVGYLDFSRKIATSLQSTLDLQIKLISDPIQLAPVEIIGESELMNKKLGGTVTKITPQTVSLIKPIGTQELLELVPGINGYADDGFGNSRLSIGIRGLNPRRSSRVFILEDGVPIQPAVYIYPNAYYNPPSERIEAVEVVKGSSAIRFGPQTMGGVINYTTRRPGGPSGIETQVTVGTNGYYSVFLDWRSEVSDQIKSDIQLLYKHGDGFRNNNSFDQLNGTLKTQYAINSKKVLYLKANANFEDSNATYTGLTEYSFRHNPRYNPKEYDNFRILRTSLDLVYTSKLTPSLISNTTVYLNYFDRRWWREDDIFIRASALRNGNLTPVPYFQSGDLIRVGGGVSNFGILRTFYVGGLSQDYTIDHRIGSNAARAEVGARLHWERFVDDKKVGSSPDARRGVYYTGTPNDPDDPVDIVGQSHHYETAALAVYAKEQIELGKLTWSPGLRFELFEQERVDLLRGAIMADKLSWVVLPGIGANYQLDRFNLFGGVHRGYTPPSSGTLKVTNFGQNTISGGLDLKAEKSWNLEAGMRSRGTLLNMEVTAFLISIENLVAAGRGTVFKNLGKVNSRGVELSLACATSRYLAILPDFNLSYTYLDTEIKSGIVKSATMAGHVDVNIEGNELPYAPAHTVTIGVAKQLTSALRLRTDVRFVDEVFTDFENLQHTFNRGDTGPIPSYSILNANIDYVLGDRWQLFITAKNLLDAVYIGSRLHSNAGQPEANLSSGILVGPRRQINFGFKRGF